MQPPEATAAPAAPAPRANGSVAINEGSINLISKSRDSESSHSSSVASDADDAAGRSVYIYTGSSNAVPHSPLPVCSTGYLISKITFPSLNHSAQQAKPSAAAGGGNGATAGCRSVNPLALHNVVNLTPLAATTGYLISKRLHFHPLLTVPSRPSKVLLPGAATALLLAAGQLTLSLSITL